MLEFDEELMQTFSICQETCPPLSLKYPVITSILLPHRTVLL